MFDVDFTYMFVIDRRYPWGAALLDHRVNQRVQLRHFSGVSDVNSQAVTIRFINLSRQIGDIWHLYVYDRTNC